MKTRVEAGPDFSAEVQKIIGWSCFAAPAMNYVELIRSIGGKVMQQPFI